MMASVFLHGMIKRPAEDTERVVSIDRPEIPEPATRFDEAFRARLKATNRDGRETLLDLFKGVADPFLDELRAYLHYVEWRSVPVRDEIRCHECNALYKPWHKRDARYVNAEGLSEGWTEVEVKLPTPNDYGIDYTYLHLCPQHGSES